MKTKFRFSLLILAIALTFATFPTAGKSAPSLEDLVVLVNQDRISHGLQPLRPDSTLNLAALAKAQDMLNNNYFSHVSPRGTKPWFWFKTLGYNYAFAGENLAVGYSNAEELERSWMASASHRANILSPDYTDIGIAVITVKNKGPLIVQFFGAKTDKLTLRQ